MESVNLRDLLTLRADFPELVAAAQKACAVPVSVVEATGEDRRVLETLADYCLRAVA